MSAAGIIVVQICEFNPYMTSGRFHPYQLEKSISKCVGVLFLFHF